MHLIRRDCVSEVRRKNRSDSPMWLPFEAFTARDSMGLKVEVMLGRENFAGFAIHFPGTSSRCSEYLALRSNSTLVSDFISINAFPSAIRWCSWAFFLFLSNNRGLPSATTVGIGSFETSMYRQRQEHHCCVFAVLECASGSVWCTEN